LNYSKFKMPIAVLLLLVLASCSSGVQKDTAVAAEVEATELSAENSEVVAVADKDNLICYNEKTIGSNRMSRRCITKADRDKQAEVSREAWLRQQQGSVKVGN
jgi:hypothetical protein